MTALVYKSIKIIVHDLFIDHFQAAQAKIKNMVYK